MKGTAVALITAIAASVAVFCGIISAGENPPPPPPPEGAPTPPAKSLPAVKVTWKATELGSTIKAPNQPQFNITVSPDGRRYACWNSDACVYIIDGVAGKECVDRSRLVFSPDSKHVAYSARTKEGKNVLIVDGVETLVEGINVTVNVILFSPDSKRTAYFVEAGGKRYVVIDGKKGKEYDGDAYNKKVRRPSDSYDTEILRAGTQIPFFSPDSKRYAYIAQSGGKWMVVVDGAEGKAYDDIVYFSGYGDTVFSPDSKHVSYMAVSGGKKSLVIDGREIEGGVWPPVFSPDDKQIAYVVQKGESAFCLVVDDKPQKEYSSVAPPVFSPDSKHIAHLAKDGEESFAVIDGVEGKKYPKNWFVGPIVYSPDSQHVAYGLDNILVVDGVEHRLKNRPESIVFSPDSKRTVCLAVDDHRASAGPYHIVVIDGVEGEERIVPASPGKQPVFQPVISPDSKHVAYCTFNKKKGDALWRPFCVVDTTELDIGVEPWCAPIFDSPTKFHFIGTKGDKVFLVEAEISE
jgi:WD40 repeat protein